VEQRIVKVEGEGKVRFLHLDADQHEEISVTSAPSLVYFLNGHYEAYEGNLINVEQMFTWAEKLYESNKDVIEDLNTEQVKALVQENDHCLVLVCKDQIRQKNPYWYFFRQAKLR